jgi:virulence-associated protein VagC
LKEIIHRFIIKKWRKFMESVIIDREILPEPIFSFIHSEKIKIFEENGNIILTPVKRKPDVNDLFGMFNDGKLSSEDFIKQKAVEKEMEN